MAFSDDVALRNDLEEDITAGTFFSPNPSYVITLFLSLGLVFDKSPTQSTRQSPSDRKPLLSVPLQLVRRPRSRLDDFLPSSSFVGSRLGRIVIDFLVELVVVLLIVSMRMLRIPSIPVGIFHHELRSTLVVFVNVMILRPPPRRLDASKAHVPRGGRPMQRGPRPERRRMIEAPIQAIYVAPPPNDPRLVLPSPHPLPNVSRHVVQAEGVWPKCLDGTGGPPSVLRLVLPGEVSVSPKVGVLLRLVRRRFFPPGVERPILGSVVPRSRGGLPLPFSGETLSYPSAVFCGVAVGYVYDRVVFSVFVGGSGSFGGAPVGFVDGHPIFLERESRER